MKLANQTDYPDYFIRRMISWACKQIDLPVKAIRKAVFANTKMSWSRRRKIAYSGRGGSGRIVVRTSNDPKSFPTDSFERYGTTHPAFADRIEALVGVAVHECYHCWQSFANNGKAWLRSNHHIEAAAVNAENDALRQFQKDREALLEAWNKEPAYKQAALAPPSPIAKRAAKAAEALARWQRKFKLAANKVKKYKAKVAYYAKKTTEGQT